MRIFFFPLPPPFPECQVGPPQPRPSEKSPNFWGLFFSCPPPGAVAEGLFTIPAGPPPPLIFPPHSGTLRVLLSFTRGAVASFFSPLDDVVCSFFLFAAGAGFPLFGPLFFNCAPSPFVVGRPFFPFSGASRPAPQVSKGAYFAFFFVFFFSSRPKSGFRGGLVRMHGEKKKKNFPFFPPPPCRNPVVFVIYSL